MPAFSVQISGTSALIGIVLSFLEQAIFIIPILLLNKKYEGKSIIDVCYEKSKVFGTIVTVCFLLVFFVVTAGGVSGFNFFMTNAVYPDASIVIIAVSITLVCFVTTMYGLQGLTRASCILFFVFVAGFIFISAVSIKSIKLLNFHPLMDDNVNTIIRYMLDITAKTSEPLVLALLFPRIIGSKPKTAYWFLIITFAFSIVASIITTGVLGDFSAFQTFPFFTLSSVIKLKIFQRLDSVHMVTWVFSSFVHITLFAGIMINLAKRLLPKKAKKFAGIVLFVGVVLTSIWFGYKGEMLKQANIPSSVINILFLGVLPIVLLFLPKNSKEDKSNEKSQATSTPV